MIGFLLIFLPYSAMWATVGVILAEVFDTRVRYSGMSLGYGIGTVLGGAIAPIIAANLMEHTGTVASVGWYLVAMAVVSAVSGVWVLDHRKRSSAPSADGATPQSAPTTTTETRGRT